jgi:hypothetical protein
MVSELFIFKKTDQKQNFSKQCDNAFGLIVGNNMISLKQ